MVPLKALPGTPSRVSLLMVMVDEPPLPASVPTFHSQPPSLVDPLEAHERTSARDTTQKTKDTIRAFFIVFPPKSII